MYVVNTVTINGSITFKTCDYVAHLKFIYYQLYLKTKTKNHSNGEKENFKFKEKQFL